MKLRLAILLGVVSFGVPVCAQVDAPLLGYLPDGARVRPIYGIPESAVVAPPLDAGPFSRIAASGDMVVASLSESGVVVRYRDGAFQPVPGTMPAPDLIVLSPGGTSAALWYTSRSMAEIVINLRGEPKVRQVHAAFRPTTPALAIADDGEWLAGIWPDGLFVLGRDRQPAPLRIEGRPRALAFSAAGQLAVASSDGIFTVDDIGGNATVTPVHSGSLRPAGVAYAGATPIVAEASGLLVPAPADCQCQPETLAPLAPGVFRLTGLHKGAVRLFDSRSGQVWFAPLNLPEASEEAAR